MMACGNVYPSTWSTWSHDNRETNSIDYTTTTVNYTWEPAADCYVIDDPPEEAIEEAREREPLPRAPKRLGKPRRTPQPIWRPG